MAGGVERDADEKQHDGRHDDSANNQGYSLPIWSIRRSIWPAFSRVRVDGIVRHESLLVLTMSVWRAVFVEELPLAIYQRRLQVVIRVGYFVSRRPITNLEINDVLGGFID